jgi:hypothetical protein
MGVEKVCVTSAQGIDVLDMQVSCYKSNKLDLRVSNNGCN